MCFGSPLYFSLECIFTIVGAFDFNFETLGKFSIPLLAEFVSSLNLLMRISCYFRSFFSVIGFLLFLPFDVLSSEYIRQFGLEDNSFSMFAFSKKWKVNIRKSTFTCVLSLIKKNNELDHIDTFNKINIYRRKYVLALPTQILLLLLFNLFILLVSTSGTGTLSNKIQKIW